MNAGLSVSRVGGAAQLPAMKSIAGTVRLELAQYNELKAFAQFGSDLDEATQKTLRRGEVLVEILKQGQYQPLDVSLQIASLYAATRGHLDKYKVSEVQDWEKQLHGLLLSNHPSLIDKIRSGSKLKEVEQELIKAIEQTKIGFTKNA